MKKLFTFIFIQIIFLFHASGQHNIRFTHLSNSDGLSQSVVNCILQDSYGYMWFGTQDGLNKYNGYSISIIKNNPHDSLSLSGNNITAICEDGDFLWIGTNESGLNLYNRFTNKFEIFQYNENDENSLIDNAIKSIVVDNNELVWIGTDNGLCSYDKNTKKFTRYNEENGSLTNNRVWSLCNSKKEKDILIVGTYGGGVHLFNKKTWKYKLILDTNEKGDLKIPKSDKVRVVMEDSKGDIWIGTNNVGLIKYELSTQSYEYFFEGNLDANLSNPRIRDIKEMSNGDLWVATFDGLNIFNPTTKIFSKYYNKEQNQYSLSNNNVRCIFSDNQESIVWLGTDGGGVNIYKKLANRFRHYHKDEYRKNTLSENTIMAIMEANDNKLWVGTLGGGIDVLDRKNRSIEHYPFNKNKLHHRILAMHQDTEGLIWIASWGGGVNFYSPLTKSFSSAFEENKLYNKTSISNNTVLDIEEDTSGNIWFATLNGLNKFNKKELKFTNYFTSDGLVNNNVNCLYFDKDKNCLLIGTNDGLCEFNLTNAKFENLNINKENIAINCIAKVEDEQYWVGTSLGLLHYNYHEQKSNWYYQIDGLPNDYIYGILVDKQKNIWVSTNFGISKLNYARYQNEFIPEFKNYFEIDGLQSNEFNQGSYFISDKNEIFFGGINGFNSFYPDKIIDNPHQPSLYITSLKIFEKEVELDSNISQKKYLELSYKDRFFSFEFVALDYNLPEKNLYSWKLEGLDETWTPPTNRRYISYNNLPGGDYVLRIRASNNDGVWNNDGISLHIRIIPPFWQTTWFYVVCILLGILIVYFYIKIREQKLKAEKHVLEQKVAERTHELQEKNRDILSSIQYAKRIQEAILPPLEEISKYFPESFVLYKPKDIVSGDFYWFGVKNNKSIIASVDCTGHGVPGAFMSMIGHNLLHQIVNKESVVDPGMILRKLDKGVVKALKQNEIDTKDGMDLALISYDKENALVEYSGAYRPLYLYRNKELTKIDANKFPIGGGKQYVDVKDFTTHKIEIKKDDVIYLFSDGYADQFGGEKGKKMMTKRFQEILTIALDLPMKEQQEFLHSEFLKWKGNVEQIDDILVIGIKF